MNTTMRYTGQTGFDQTDIERADLGRQSFRYDNAEYVKAPPQRFYTPDESAGSRWQYGQSQTGSLGGVGSAGTVGMPGAARLTGPPGAGSKRARGIGSSPNDVLNNVVAVESAVSGVGVSTLASLVARNLAQSGVTCALVDADLQGGGLDVLLGIENEDGTRFGDINAPLGSVNGKALLREMPAWDGVPVLSCDPWKSSNPQSWDVRACIQALSQVRDVVIVDAAQRIGLQEVSELDQCARIVVVELTVLGLARAKTMLRSSMQERSKLTEDTNRILVVGAEPRGTLRKRGITEIGEAESYLECGIAAVMQPDAHLCSEQLEGLGLRNPNKSTAKAIRTCVDFILEQLENKRGKHGTRSP